MKYMLIFSETAAQFEERGDPIASGPYWGAWNNYIAALGAAGVIVNGDGLQGPETATTVRVRNGQREVQDGPFPDTKESLGGYFVIEVDDLDSALDWAAQAPSASYASVEVRPVMPPPANNI